ncbi:hypothetical protein KFE25_002914 [Diacronema lutheri]|uniref:K Homology domain-containing protein n=1 Tax=Diacronema lutheri TaxID=2081491 RepID=A0A8J6C8R0_DIALT|nr:hypothetical protein KFE25_002914 [Diacronema lutheri]
MASCLPAAAAPVAEEAARKPRRKRTWEAADAPASDGVATPAPAVSASVASLAHVQRVAALTGGGVSGCIGLPPGVIAPPPTGVLPAPALSGVPPSGLPPPPVPPPPLAARLLAPGGALALPAPALSREIEINQSKNKAALTRKATHEQIHQATGTTVSIRGRYKPPGDSSTDERPLYLLLSAPTVDALDKAEEQLRELMGPAPAVGDAATPAATATPAGGGSASGLHEAKVLVDLTGIPVAGSVRGKVLGPRGTYIRHIETEAGVRVQLVGGLDPILPGQQMEPLAIDITAASEAQLSMAKGLAESLIRAVRHKLLHGGGGGGMGQAAQVQPPPAHVQPLSGLPPPPPPPPGFAPMPPAYAPPAFAPPPGPYAPYAPHGPPGSYAPPASYAPVASFAPALSQFAPPSTYGGTPPPGAWAAHTPFQYHAQHPQ